MRTKMAPPKRTFLLLLAGCLATVVPAYSQVPGQKPSLILVTIDTVRADYLPMWGATDIETPALASLAADGVVFSQAVTTNPQTRPAHVSLMTGTFPQFHQIRDNSAGVLGADIPTLASTLKAEGYATGAVLSSAILDRRFGLDQGFDFYGDQFQPNSSRSGGLAERLAVEAIDEAIGWLRKNSTRPFFLWVHLYDPHSPYEAPGRYKSRGYKGEIEYADSQLARLLDYLKTEGLYEPSLIVTLSDHGEDLYEHGEPYHGYFIYETVLKIPLIIKFPANQWSGRTLDFQVRITDILPTIAQVLRLELSPIVQGTGLLSMVLGKRAEPLVAYSESLYPNLHFGWSSLFSIRSGFAKFIAAPEPELYDLKADPGERHNLYAERTALANQLKAQLDAFRSRFEQREAVETVALDPELQERLRSLGYTTLAAGRPVTESQEGPDPKRKIGIYRDTVEGMQFQIQGDYEKAVESLMSAVRKEPGVGEGYDLLARSKEPLSQRQSGKSAVELAPAWMNIFASMGFSYLKLARNAEAIGAYRAVIGLDPESLEAWRLLGVAYSGANDLPAAADVFKEVLRRSPGDRQSLYNLGSVYERQGRFLLAVEVLRTLTDKYPDDGEGWGSLATNLQYAGLSDLADGAYQRALELLPEDPSVLYNYANLLVKRNRLDDAVSYYRRSIGRNPSFAEAYYNLSVVLETLGRQAEAKEALARFQALKKK